MRRADAAWWRRLFCRGAFLALVPIFLNCAQAQPAPGEGRATLLLLEQRLPAGSVLHIPDEVGDSAWVASDLAVRETLEAVLADLFAPPATFAPKAIPLVEELCRVRPDRAVEWVETGAAALLAARPETLESDLTRLIRAGVAADSARLAILIGSLLVRLDDAACPSIDARPALPPERFARLISRCVETALSGVRETPQAVPVFRAVLAECLRLGRERQASLLLVESVAAIARSARGLADFDPGAIARAAFAESPGREMSALVAGAILRGAGVENVQAVRDQAALNLPVAVASFVALSCNAYTALHEAPFAAAALQRLIAATNADFIPAMVLGATLAKPAAATEILATCLARDLVLRGRSTVGDILHASLLAAPIASAELVAAAFGRGDLAEGDASALLAAAIVRGLSWSQVPAALAAQLRIQPRQPEMIASAVAGSLAGVAAVGRQEDCALLTANAARATQQGAAVLEQALLSAPRAFQHLAVLGVIAALPEDSAGLLARALAHPALEPSHLPALQAAGELAIEIHRMPLHSFPLTIQRLTSSENADPACQLALLQVAALANPRGFPAVAAFARGTLATPSAILLRLGEQATSRGAVGAEMAIDAAGLYSAEPAATLRDLRRIIRTEPTAAVQVALGAAVGQPGLAAPLGAVAAESAPGEAGRILRALFAFTGAQHPAAPAETPAEHAAALTGAVMRGLVRAGLDADSERALAAEVAAAAARSALALRPDGSSLASVLGAAVAAGPADAVALVRSASRAARAMQGSQFQPAMIVDAALRARPALEPLQIQGAVEAGREDADRHVPAASARSLSDYSYDSLTGVPLSRYHDL